MRLLVVFLGFLCFAGVQSTYRTYSGYKVYNVFVETSDDIASLMHLQAQFDFWRRPSLFRPASVLVEPEQDEIFHAHMQSLGLTVELSIPDIGPLIKDHLADERPTYPTDSRNFYETYHTLQEIYAWMSEIATNHSDLVRMLEVSRSYEDRPIYAFLISTDPEIMEKPAVWFDGGIHAREWISPASVMYFTNQLLSEYGVDSTVTTLLDEMDWYILPAFNVDGYEYSWTDDRMWRKTRSPNEGSECIGTDPNRNWDIAWGTVGVSHDPCTDTYCGSEAFSEIEVANVASYIEANPRIVAYLAYHSYGQMYMAPYGYQEELPPDFEKLMAACEQANEVLYEVHGEVYHCDALINLVGPSSGSSADYTYDKLNITWSYGVELRDTGEYGFLLPEELILPTAEENYAFLLDLGTSILEDISSRK